MRRCGKSYLLFEIFVLYLKEHSISSEQIIAVDLEDYRRGNLESPTTSTHIHGKPHEKARKILFCSTKSRCSSISRKS